LTGPGKKCNIPHGFTDLDSFFQSGIDAVSITSPAPCHYRNVLDAAKYRLPVLCEKPLASHANEAKEMIEAMEQAGASLYCGFCYRFSPAALKIRELVHSGAIGRVRSLRLIYNWGLHGKYAKGVEGGKILQPRREGRMEEGGPLVDCGTHQIDLAHFWLGSGVVSFHGHGAWVDDYAAPDHVWLHLDHACGAHTLVEVSFSYGHTCKNPRPDFRYELIGSEGVIRYDREGHSFTLDTVDGTETLEFHPEKSFEGLYAEWARALSGGESILLTSAEDGQRVVEIARTTTDKIMASKGRAARGI
jgi:predicted dehydrogenase